MTQPNPATRVSVVIATHNRCDALHQTFQGLASCGLRRDAFEVIVVDNASTDGTDKLADTYADRVVRLAENAGSCAKADGIAHAHGEFILFLDDDSHPVDASVARMLDHFDNDQALGAAGFSVYLPSGARECGALVDVFVGCGVGFRARALHQAGGLDRSFFMQAEEYDLTFRLTQAGWRVRVFDDLRVRHEKTAQSRQTERTTYFDVRNNLRVVARHLPAPLHRIYRYDLLTRYEWLAVRAGHHRAFERGARDGRIAAIHERRAFQNRRLTVDQLEHFFAWRRITSATNHLAQRGVRRVVLADFGKNIFAFFDACRSSGIEVTAIGDDRFADPGRRYRGIPILPLNVALDTSCEAVIVSNCAPVFAEETGARIAYQCCKPVFQWFGAVREPARQCDKLVPPTRVSDKSNVASPCAMT